jgi:hypothetical protein
VSHPEKIQDWEQELEAWPWRFAKTMPHIPHWYVVRGETVTDEQFDALERFIRGTGFEGIWTSPGGHRMRNTYCVIGEWSYWVIENIINRDVATTSTVERVAQTG